MTDSDRAVPNCIFCGEQQRFFTVSDAGIFSSCVYCEPCQAGGPIALDENRQFAEQRALDMYSRAAHMLTVLKKTIGAAQKELKLIDATKLSPTSKKHLLDTLKLLKRSLRNSVLRNERKY